MVNEREQSEFNMAVSYLNRLNALLYVCDESSMEMNVNQWFHSLLALYREISTEMSKTEIEEKNLEIKELFEIITRHIKNENRKGKQGVDQEIYWRLHNLEMFLRKILKSAGLQSKMKDDAAHALK